ncbi:MAG: hypothetical protein KTU85_11025 [Acidimicrobiia bacterium]|nr:hypothetical protein [Acidimicrobiia bacterium]MCY4456927.1 hypothetical protein [Acidimicrobiaceae bacterium]
MVTVPSAESDQTETTQDKSDWISGVVDIIVNAIAKTRTYGTENAIRAVRALVYGLVALVFIAAALILIIIIGVRLADAYLPIGAGVGDATWAAHLLIGGLLAILGSGFWFNRKSEGMRWVNLALILDVGIIVVIICYGIIDFFV